MKIRFFCCALALGLSACGAEQQEQEQVLRSVRYVEVSDEAGGRLRSFSGTSQSAQQSRMSFKVPGTIIELPVQVGDLLQRGDLIARLDASEYQLQAQQAQASLAQAEAAARNADANYDRVKGLYENANASRNDLDASRAASESSKAQVGAAQKAVELANLNISYTRLSAGFDCTIASLEVELNENVAVGSTIASVNCGNEIEVLIDVPESIIGAISPGMHTEVSFSALPDRSYDGYVTEVGVSSANAVTFPIVVAIENSGSDLLPGLAAQVAFEFERREGSVHLLPLSAIVNKPEGAFVFIADPEGNEAVLRLQAVEISELTEGGIEVVSGLSEGDYVVTAGVSVVRDGMRVKL